MTLRNVHQTNGKFAENVARDELTYAMNERFTTKLLAIYQRMPRTHAGIDPFLFDPSTGIFDSNITIQDGMDPTIKTGSLGAEYKFTEWLALSGIWEYTNDSTVAYNNFPRSALNDSSFAAYTQENNLFLNPTSILYNQGLFPLPPYDFFNVYKSGLRINPTDKTEIYLDYTRNEYKSAGQISDDINHVGMEFSYHPTKKLGIFASYTYSRWNDINRMLAGFDKIYLGHHDFFTEFRYNASENDELALQYGVSSLTPITTVSYDPYGGSLQTLDTQHIIRCYYRRKF